VKLAGELGLHFRLLGDPDLHVATSYGVAMAGQDIAVPSVFIVRKDRSIAWSQVGENMTDRASTAAILAQVRAASAAAPAKN
jgi:peroxiredoxin